MSRAQVLLVSVLVVACGTTTYTVAQEPVALAAPGPGGPWPSVGYWGPHPVPAGYGGGFDYTEGPHTHPYTPDQPDLYAVHEGWFVFVGDPYFYGYDGPMRWYAGPHVLRYPWGDVVCPIDGPHRHWAYATAYVVEPDYVYVDGFWVYVGLWPVWWHHDHVVYLERYWPERYHEHYAPHQPRAHAAMQAAPTHHVEGHTEVRPGQPGVHDVPPAQGGPGAHSGLKPAYDENRPRTPDPDAPDRTGVFHSRGAGTDAAAEQGGAPRPAVEPVTPPAEGRAGAHPGLKPAYDENRPHTPDPDAADRTGVFHSRGAGTDAPDRTGAFGATPPTRDDARPSGPGAGRAVDGRDDGDAVRAPGPPRDVTVPRAPKQDVPPRYNVDPRPAPAWQSAPSSRPATRPAAPAARHDDDEAWRKKASSRPAAPAVDRGRSGPAVRPSGGGRHR